MMKKNLLLLALFFLTGLSYVSAQKMQPERNGLKGNDCNPPTNFAVAYTGDCKAELTWVAPAKTRSTILWNNTDASMSNYGLFACYWSGNDNWIVSADDFVADEVWVIEKIYSKGTPSGTSATPTKFSVVIYNNSSANKPGTEIYRNNAIAVSDGQNPEITLPTPFTLPCAGTYWISIAAAYDVSVTDGMGLEENRWNIMSNSATIGLGVLTHNKLGIFWWPTEWTDPTYYLGDNTTSMYFQIEGTKEGTGNIKKYNVYRDDAPIAENITNTYYTDQNFTHTEGHTWKVTTVCEEGESVPASVTKGICEEESVTYTLTAFVNGIGGTIDPEGTTIVTQGENQTYSIMPNEGYHILQILIDGENNPVAVETGTYTFSNVMANHSIVASFENVGITEMHDRASLQVYPNPTTGELRIEICDMGYETCDMRYEIYDVFGKNVSNLKSKISNQQINISHLPAGIYFLQIETEKGVIYEKVIKH